MVVVKYCFNQNVAYTRKERNNTKKAARLEGMIKGFRWKAIKQTKAFTPIIGVLSNIN